MRFVDARHRTLALIGAVVALPAAAIAAAPAAADSSRPQEVLAALQSQPVYVAPSVLDQLDRVAANRLQLRIAKKDVGRIHIAVIPLSWAADAGGVAAFGRAMDADTPEPGALLVIASSAKREDGYVITSHNHATAAADAVRRALASSDALEPQLSRAIDALTEVDPGPSGDINQASSPGSTTPSNPPFKIPDPNKIINTVNDTIKWTVIAIIVAILSPFLYIGWRIFRAGRRQREDDAETFADA
ncbi:MAG: hypothetical protein QOG59_3450, partial [Solirubrobacteraceae bacterium]|nr:hypothetical protein [Solirubrobacteraceae bacterium]